MSLIYIADDEPDVASLIKEILVDAGHDVVAANDGQVLLQNLSRQKPDLILLDINMPGLSGWDVRKLLREDPRTADIPVIAVTAQGGQSIETSAVQTLGFSGFVRKPFKIADLVGTVEGQLAKA